MWLQREGPEMEIHEYQVKKLFKHHGLPVLKGGIAYTSKEAVRVAESIGGMRWAIKAQIHDNNRYKGFFIENDAGEGSGFRFAQTLQDVQQVTEQMLGKTLITPTTYHQGHEVKKVYIEEVVDIKESFQISLRIDEETQRRVLVLLRENGQLKKYDLTGKGITTFLMHRMANRMKLSVKATSALTAIIRQMYHIFEAYKARAIELTPLILTKENNLVILDGRVVFDGDALFAYPEISALREIDVGTEREHSARQNNFKYTKFGGNIACIVNGTGLGMATVDLISDKGGAVSCLLDIGTEPSKEVVAKAFRMVLGEPDIEGVLVNIFGGITRCDVIAQGLISASHEISVGMPLVVRMDGTNAAVGCRLLQESHLPFELIEQMDKAVEKIVARVEEVA